MKRVLIFILVLSFMLPLAGCGKKGGNTPLEEAYNAVYNARRKISGFDKECIKYIASEDVLQLYASPSLDYAALIGIIEKTVDGREVNTVVLLTSSVSWEPAEALLEAFSMGFTAPVKRLVLPWPHRVQVGDAKNDLHVEQPKLWRESLERLGNVGELVLSAGTGQTSDYSYLYDIAEGGTIRIPCDLHLKPIDNRLNLAGLEVVSDQKRLVIERDARYLSAALNLYGYELLDAATTQIDLGQYCGSLSAAELAYKLRALGFTVIGISDNPRDDLNEEDAGSYDAIVSELEYVDTLLKENMGFDKRLEGYLSLSYHVSDDMRLDAAIAVLKSFYALEGTDGFTVALERMCSYDAAHSTGSGVDMEKSLHEHILKRVCQDLADSGHFDRFLTEVVGSLPTNGSWCKTELSLTNIDGETVETTALVALMAGYERLFKHAANVQRILEDDQIDLLCDALDKRDLLCGYYNSRNFTGDAERDIATANRLLDAGRIDDSEVYGLVFGKVGNDLDAFLHTTAQWDEAYGQLEVRKYRTDEESLSTDDDRFDKNRYVNPNTDKPIQYDGGTMGHKALFAYETREGESLFFPKDAYRWFVNDDGNLFRAISPRNTPDSADEAELLIIAWTSYVYVSDYTDGTKAYRCVADVYAYGIATGECLEYIGTVVSEPPSSAPAATKYDVYASPNLLGLYQVTGRWLGAE